MYACHQKSPGEGPADPRMEPETEPRAIRGGQGEPVKTAATSSTVPSVSRTDAACLSLGGLSANTLRDRGGPRHREEQDVLGER